MCKVSQKSNKPFRRSGVALRRGDNSTYTFTKRGVVYLVSATPPKPLIGFL
jgi:hypothetical protein